MIVVRGVRRALASPAASCSSIVYECAATICSLAHRSLLPQITQRTRDEVFAITRKALTDLADTTLEASMSDAFIRRLRAITGTDKTSLDAALKNATTPSRIRSAFDLPEEQRAAIGQAINETFSADIQIEFVVVPDVISGIELTAGGQKVAWSIADYLASMEQRIGELTAAAAPDASKPATSGKVE